MDIILINICKVSIICHAIPCHAIHHTTPYIIPYDMQYHTTPYIIPYYVQYHTYNTICQNNHHTMSSMHHTKSGISYPNRVYQTFWFSCCPRWIHYEQWMIKWYLFKHQLLRTVCQLQKIVIKHADGGKKIKAVEILYSLQQSTKWTRASSCTCLVFLPDLFHLLCQQRERQSHSEGLEDLVKINPH